MKYNSANLSFTIENSEFIAVNFSFERIMNPYPKHSHGKNCYEIHYIPSGKGKVIVNEKDYPISSNCLYVTGPYVEHEQIPDSTDSMTEYCIYVILNDKQKPQPLLGHWLNTPFWFGEGSHVFHEYMQKIFYELKHREAGYKEMIEANLKLIVVFLIRNYMHYSEKTLSSDIKASFDTKNKEKIFLMIEDAFLFDYKDITLDELAKRLRLSNRQTERLLKSHYKKTFLQKKLESRMSAATTMLRNPKLTITSIAFTLGYSSVEHFSNAFKHYYHISASAYRKSIDDKVPSQV